jgi:hypothetical protein
VRHCLNLDSGWRMSIHRSSSLDHVKNLSCCGCWGSRKSFRPWANNKRRKFLVQS